MATRLDNDLPSRDDIEKLISACSKRAPTGRRNAAMIATAWRSGLRVSELTALTLKDVDLTEGRITVQRGKGGKRRVVGLDAGTAALIERWLQSRGTLRLSRSAPLFCTLDGGTIDTSYLRHLFKRLTGKAAIGKRIHPHALRHRMAVDLIQEGADLVTVQKLLGHSSAATTSIYLSRLGATEAVAFARARDWTPPVGNGPVSR